MINRLTSTSESWLGSVTLSSLSFIRSESQESCSAITLLCQGKLKNIYKMGFFQVFSSSISNYGILNCKMLAWNLWKLSFSSKTNHSHYPILSKNKDDYGSRSCWFWFASRIELKTLFQSRNGENSTLKSCVSVYSLWKLNSSWVFDL